MLQTKTYPKNKSLFAVRDLTLLLLNFTASYWKYITEREIIDKRHKLSKQ